MRGPAISLAPLVLGSPGAAPSRAASAVVWSNLTGAVANGPTLTKTDLTADWTAQGNSARQLRSGAGYFEFRVVDDTHLLMAGLSSDTENAADFSDITWALYLGPGDSLNVYERGSFVTGLGAFATGDVLRVAVEGGVVAYRQNGVLKYTSLIAPSYPIRVDTSFFDPGGSIVGLSLVGAWS